MHDKGENIRINTWISFTNLKFPVQEETLDFIVKTTSLTPVNREEHACLGTQIVWCGLGVSAHLQMTAKL